MIVNVHSYTEYYLYEYITKRQPHFPTSFFRLVDSIASSFSER